MTTQNNQMSIANSTEGFLGRTRRWFTIGNIIAIGILAALIAIWSWFFSDTYPVQQISEKNKFVKIDTFLFAASAILIGLSSGASSLIATEYMKSTASSKQITLSSLRVFLGGIGLLTLGAMTYMLNMLGIQGFSGAALGFYGSFIAILFLYMTLSLTVFLLDTGRNLYELVKLLTVESKVA